MFIDILRIFGCLLWENLAKEAVACCTLWPLGEILCEMGIFWSVTPFLKHQRPSHGWFKHMYIAIMYMI